MDRSKPIKISNHAKDKMVDRGASEDEVKESIRTGNEESARRDRKQFKKNFEYGNTWQDEFYEAKQVCPVVAEEDEFLVVVTVFVYYF